MFKKWRKKNSNRDIEIVFWNTLSPTRNLFQLYRSLIPFISFLVLFLTLSLTLFRQQNTKYSVFLFTCCFNTGRMANEKYIRYKVLVYFAALWIIIYLLLLSLFSLSYVSYTCYCYICAYCVSFHLNLSFYGGS